MPTKEEVLGPPLPAPLRQRTRNPMLNSIRGARFLTDTQRPYFELLPPHGFGVLTTTGRVTGKPRYRCVRAIRPDGAEVAYLVTIKADLAGWLKNIRASPEVDLRIRSGRFRGLAREITDPAERDRAREAYVSAVNPFDYAECLCWLRGWPTRAKIQALHRHWCATGAPLAVELGEQVG